MRRDTEEPQHVYRVSKARRTCRAPKSEQSLSRRAWTSQPYPPAFDGLRATLSYLHRCNEILLQMAVTCSEYQRRRHSYPTPPLGARGGLRNIGSRVPLPGGEQAIVLLQKCHSAPQVCVCQRGSTDRAEDEQYTLRRGKGRRCMP